MAGAAAVVAGGAASLVACRPARDVAVTLDPIRLRFGLADILAPERVGAVYRAGRNREQLLAEANAKPGLLDACSQDCPVAIRATLRMQSTEDFRQNDILVADRFIVARSECIIAALVA